ncbi:cytochrome c oxidase subunit II [Ramlibacter sp. AW1]|uniref:cytochrome-c oxidase n=1 Tax=Ramlibacter aurantiacus TaxID=2801330 RepID=A0A937D4X6_9BURK|nr:cytochrome c oxidase subunit II [Ramlibacter aurantiacus]MBL0419333.1 cytochrome c oxidase subunit II [Ramlibacter aurantiacus]
MGIAPPAVWLLAGCAGPLSTLDPAGPSAHAIAVVWWWMLGVATLVLLGVVVLWLVAMRSRRGHSHEQARRSGLRWLVGGGLVLPGVAVVALVVFGAPAGLHQLPLPDPDGGEPPLRIDVRARQFQWDLHYPDTGLRLRDELRLPVGRTVHLHVTSDDVIHSFWVPRLGGKLDALPGRVQVVRLRADQAGEFLGQCAEYCGVGHAHMKMVVHAMEPQAFAQWMASRPGTAQEGVAR